MNWTNASNPPPDIRTVLCLMVDGTQCRGRYDGTWKRIYGPSLIRLEQMETSPVGWRELEDSDE